MCLRAAILSGVALAGCTVGPRDSGTTVPLPPARLSQRIDPASGPTQRVTVGAVPLGSWWRAFGSPKLNALVAATFAHNNDLAAAEASLRQAEEQARNGLRTLLPEASQLESVHCGTSLCRIEITHRTHDDLQHFSEQLMLSAQPALWNGAMLTALSPDSREGQLLSVIYMSREGRSLPSLASL